MIFSLSDYFKLHHYGFATKSLDKSAKEFLKLGYSTTSNIIRDEIQGVDLLFIKNKSDHLIELVAPIEGINGPVSDILKRSGSGFYHVCYEVIDLDKSLSYLSQNRFIVVLKPTPAIAFDNRIISFLYNSNLGLIEILQK